MYPRTLLERTQFVKWYRCRESNTGPTPCNGIWIAVCILNRITFLVVLPLHYSDIEWSPYWFTYMLVIEQKDKIGEPDSYKIRNQRRLIDWLEEIR